MIERNELNARARGGTELMQERLIKYVPNDLLSKFQIIPSRVRELDPNKKKILWLHDLPNDPESAHLSDVESRKRFDKIVAVSNWQMQLYNMVLGLPYGECVVLKNAIDPILVPKKEYDSTVRIIYHTTPHRGLEILVPVFEKLCEVYENIHLDVYSSFGVYGWEERDAPYRILFDRCRAHPQITYHGAVSNEEVREALVKSHIFAYPSIWPETSCIAAIEAMSAMNIVVCPNYAALPETCANFAMMYPFQENKDLHAIQFAHTLNNAIKAVIDNGGVENEFMRFQKEYFDHFYSMEKRAQEWTNLLNVLQS
jgi:glycosyltransferase involved in cell wall biosynthesis